ncbi:MAG: alpha amylase N-terminal ig-like domain-containing protein [Oscillospiraceae bacterium]|nr:alpha amylase N-terminal ig-like domain-containing protein [Oscillospiraceae bacterium]
MNLNAISHRSALTDCYCLDRDTAVLNLRTGKDITAVNLVYEDPYAYGISGDIHWIGIPLAMEVKRELKHSFIWTAQVRPKYKRLQYYFEIFCGDEKLLMFEDDFYTEEQLNKKGRWKQYFKLAWMNECDVIRVPDWVEGTVWYQIMPDRFCRGGQAPKRMKLKDWEDRETVGGHDFYGGDLRGIIQKLPYLRELGVTGIYLLPLFESDTNHKYNIFDYTRIDPDFGTEEDVKELVEKAHSLGIRVMLDAVFNHCGTEFFAWKDVWEKGENSRYFDWFCINRVPFERKYASLTDGRYYGFAFLDNMPKLNTGNPEVADYCAGLCKYWVENWNIDGIRFDVGNEISHSFLKKVNGLLKPIKPDLFLLGEIWMDSIAWLQGDEYDSVMNYPFFESMHNFWVDADADSRDFMYAMNRCYSLYPEQTNRVIFNFLDTHDTLRALNRCGSEDVFYQQLAVLMTMPGSACIYYGTEIAMPGGHDPDCRRTMLWGEIDAGVHDEKIALTKGLIALRKEQMAIRGTEIRWHHSGENPRLICYDRPGGAGTVRVWLNGQKTAAAVPGEGQVLFARKYGDCTLAPGGILIEKIGPERS